MTKESLGTAANSKVIVTYKLTQSQKKQLVVLYQREWWCNERTLEDVETIIQGSSFIIGLLEPNTDKLIGFVRVLTDYFKYAYIYDVIVDPHYRGEKLGEKLMNLVLQHPDIKNLKSIELNCLKSMTPFYE